MNLYEEIARTAYELYEKSGYIGGRDFENWLDAERIVLTRHASQDIEEPEGEEPIIAEEGIIEEVEGTTPMYAKQKKEEYTTVVEELEVQSPAVGTKEDIAIKTEKIRPAKPAVAKGKKVSPKKTGQKSREKYL
ncbi:MAG: DUF2934 domain-containing protein [Nitrospirae bacterium]|nr:DUF2934 domain-containing protein [Nitrospirota bacterium]